MTWADARERARVVRQDAPASLRIVARAEDFPPPSWERRDLTGPEAERWYGWSPILALAESVVRGNDGAARYVALVPDLPFTEPDGKTVKVQAVLWGKVAELGPEGGTLYRRLPAARRQYDQLTRGRILPPLPEGLG